MRKNIKQKNIENSETDVSRSTSNGMINKQIKNNKGLARHNVRSTLGGFTPTPNLMSSCCVYDKIISLI